MTGLFQRLLAWLRPAEKPEKKQAAPAMPDDDMSMIDASIEDDILVTDAGNENLTRGVPVEMDEIEAILEKRG